MESTEEGIAQLSGFISDEHDTEGRGCGCRLGRGSGELVPAGVVLVVLLSMLLLLMLLVIMSSSLGSILMEDKEGNPPPPPPFKGSSMGSILIDDREGMPPCCRRLSEFWEAEDTDW